MEAETESFLASLSSPIPLVLVGAILLLIALALLHRRMQRGGMSTVRTATSPMPDISADRLARVTRVREEEARPVTQADRDFAHRMLMGVVAQVQHEAGLDEQRGQEAMVARLALQVPIREHERARSWLGGAPEMPAHLPWPDTDGRPAVFLAQIACADLPPELWDGLGPRHGWLAFFVHPREYRMEVLHLAERGEPREGPVPDDVDGWFNPASGFKHTKLAHKAKQAFPRWPVDVVAVTPGSADPRREGDCDALHVQYREGYDLAAPEHHPFDWESMLAMLDIVEQWVTQRRDSSSPDMLLEQLRTNTVKLAEAERAPEPPANLEQLRNWVRDQPALIEACRRSAAMIEAAVPRVQMIAARARERAARVRFSEEEAASIMHELGAIEWIRVKVENDPSRGPGSRSFPSMQLPLTAHHPDAGSWVYHFESLRFDWAKHAYCRAPESLPPVVRAHFERQWAEIAAHEMAGMGHVPFQYVHEFDEEHDVTLLELPTSGLMSWMFGDVDNLVLTMTKADLAAGRFDALKVQVSN